MKISYIILFYTMSFIIQLHYIHRHHVFAKTHLLCHFSLMLVDFRFGLCFRNLLSHCTSPSANRPFSYSKKESGSNDISLDFVEFSNVHNTDRSSDATQSKLLYKNV